MILNLKRYVSLLSVALILSSCGAMGIFEDEEAPLQGERISVLELTKSLQPEETNSSIFIPKSWKNEYWPQSGGYPNHVMQNLSFDSSNLDLQWKSSIGAKKVKDIPLSSSPIIAGDKLYIINNKNYLVSLSVKNGEQIWKISLSPEDEKETVISGGVSYSNNIIYATNGFKELIAVSPDNGEILWRKELPSPARAAPTVMGDRIFISTMDNRILAISALEKNIIWEHQAINETTELLGTPSPAANRDIVISAFSSGEIYALRIENGSVLWSDNLFPIRKMGGLSALADIKALPVIGNSAIYSISFGGRAIAIDERTGKRIWQKEIGGTETPWLAGDVIYLISNSNELVALESETGNIIWVTALPKYEDEEDKDGIINMHGPIMAGNYLFVVGSNGIIYKISPKTGNIAKTYDSGKNIIKSPVIANNTLYLLANDGTIMAYR